MGTPPILTATVPTAEVLAISGHMVPEDHQHTIRPTSYVLRLILLSLVLRLTEVELLVRFVTNKCSPTSPRSTSPISPPTETYSKLVPPRSAMVPLALQQLPGLAISQSSVVGDKNFHENENPFQRTFTNIESFYMLELVQRLIILGKIMLIKIFMQQFFGLGLARGIVFIEKSERNPYHLLKFISLFKPL